MFGPFDITVDFDKVGKPLDSEVWELIDPAAQRLIEKNVPLGTTVFRAKTGNKLKDVIIVCLELLRMVRRTIQMKANLTQLWKIWSQASSLLMQHGLFTAPNPTLKTSL